MTGHAGPFAEVQALIDLSAVDLLYADLYLHRAEALLPQLCTREQYQTLHDDQLRLPRLTGELQQGAERGDWKKVRSLAQEAASARQRLAVAGQIVPLADAVYGPRLLHCDATTLALNGVVVQPDTTLASARDAVLDQLRTLASQDADWASFCRSRMSHFERCQLVSGEKGGSAVDMTQLRQQILLAITAGDFARIKRLTESVAAEPTARAARLHAPRPPEERVRALAAAFPDPVVSRAAKLGLTLETLPAVGSLNAYLSCGCADRAPLPAAPVTETDRPVENCTCGHACPPDVRPSLRENLDLLMGHPFISSAGLRYLPWFGLETVLVETFPETDPDTATGLLSALGLAKRRGCARILIEDALLTSGPRVCAELGLEPAADFVIACVPFDAYVRLAAKYGWGRQELWTHLDGYQVTRELQLWALVGGHARFGAGDNLSALVRDYDSDRLTVRFAVLRRQRFAVRATQEAHS